MPCEVEPLLDSIALQQGISFDDVGVIIAFDGEDAYPLPLSQWARHYPFEVTKVAAEKGGVSHTRNAALDAASAEYVMFCDADDMFLNACGLYLIMREIDNGGFDTFVSVFVEELKRDGEFTYVNHATDSTFVHGKVHRREYLASNGLRFNDALTVHEDSYFNILAQNLTDNAKYCPNAFYLWKWRDSSVCRHDPKYILKTYSNMLDSNDALVCEFERRDLKEKARHYACFMVLDAYYTMNKPEWIDVNNEDYRAAVTVRFAEYYKKHKHYWEEITAQERMQLSSGIRQRSVGEGMQMETLTLDQWLETIELVNV